MEPTAAETSPTKINSSQFELSPEGIPLVAKEGKKVESKQFRQLTELVDHKQAMRIYTSIKHLENNEFKNSQAIDENGELMFFWHGSPRKFDQFRTDAKGEWKWRNEGLHFSSSKELVKQYANKAQEVFDFVCIELLRSTEKVTAETTWNAERSKKVAILYNEIIKDLIENGENSRFYKKAYKYDPVAKMPTSDRQPDMDAIMLGEKSTLATEEFLELFGGEMPSKENTSFLEFNTHLGNDTSIYWGNNIGRYRYATVLNIVNPFKQETYNLDWDFEQGEKSHKQNGTDGTILFHPNGLIGIGMQKVEKARGTYSVAVFDASKIIVIGREENGNFVVNQRLTT